MEDLVFQLYNTPERKDRPGGPDGGVMIYVKHGIHYKRRNNLELKGVECIWIELVKIVKKYSLVSSIGHQIITGDFNFIFLNSQTKRKIDMLCTQFSLHQPQY